MMYNRKYKHNVGMQCLMGMDGMMFDIFTDCVGRNNDRAFCALSNTNNMLANAQLHLPQNQQKKAYSDGGFDTDTHIVSAYHGPAHVTPAQEYANHLMSPERVFEEDFVWHHEITL